MWQNNGAQHHQSYSLSTDADLDTLGVATNPDTEVEDDAHTSATTVSNLVIVELMEGEKPCYRLILIRLVYYYFW